MNKLLAILLITTLSASGFAAQIPGVKIFYFPEKDAMTDENLGRVVVAEVNDTAANTYFTFYCRNSSVDVFLTTKHQLLTPEEFEGEKRPNLMYRIDTQPASTIATGTTTVNDEPDYTSLSFTTQNDRVLYNAFAVARTKVVVRVILNDGRKFDYTFPANGFLEAFRKVGNCK